LQTADPKEERKGVRKWDWEDGTCTQSMFMRSLSLWRASYRLWEAIGKLSQITQQKGRTLRHRHHLLSTVSWGLLLEALTPQDFQPALSWPSFLLWESILCLQKRLLCVREHDEFGDRCRALTVMWEWRNYHRVWPSEVRGHPDKSTFVVVWIKACLKQVQEITEELWWKKDKNSFSRFV
jgi:hypothetical protein